MTDSNETKDPKLAQRIEEIEKLIREGGNRPGYSLAAILETAQAQVDRQRTEASKALAEKKESEQKSQNAAIAEMVERETRLNAEEKERYEKLLQKEYFTKADFDDLDQFYSHSYDKLSSEGKAEMHKRIEEGIKRGAFTRDELPKSVRNRDEDSKAVETQSEVQAGRATKVSDTNSKVNAATGRDGADPSDQKDQVAYLRDATDSDPAKLKQAAAKARASVPSDSLQGLEMAFDDSSEPTKPTAAASNSGGIERAI